jgi:predicted neuraminidase
MAWFTGEEGMAGVAIAMSRLARSSQKWETPVVVSVHPGHSNQNPVLFLDPETQTLHLLHTSQKAGQGQGTSKVPNFP